MKEITITDENFEDKMVELFKLLTDQQSKLASLFDEGPDEFSPEAIFGEI